jgi:hypothetical protein
MKDRIYKYNGVKLKAVRSDEYCNGCYFDKKDCQGEDDSLRKLFKIKSCSDPMSVIFRELSFCESLLLFWRKK